MFQRFKSFALKVHSIIGSLFLLLCMVSVIGCSTISTIERSTKKMVRDIKTSDHDLKKRIGIVWFDNKTTLVKNDVEKKFVRYLSENISSSCPNLLLEKPDESDYPNILAKVPRSESGYINGLALAKAGRQLGLNAIVTGALITIVPEKRKKGIWWFKDTHYFVQIRIATEVYDTQTAAKLLDESFAHEVEVEQTDMETIQADHEINASIVDKAFKAIADHMSEKICDAIFNQPWRGFIASINADKIRLNSGEKIGLKTGELFDVIDCNKVYEGLKGRRFFLPGAKAGEIKITAVNPDSAEANLVSGHDMQIGFCIQPKE